jgi:hypothetical protein
VIAGVDVWIHVFLTSALVGSEWSPLRPDRFTPGKGALGVYLIGGWVGPKTGLEDVERRKILSLPGPELRALGHPARSQSLYRLRSPRSWDYLPVSMDQWFCGDGFFTGSSKWRLSVMWKWRNEGCWVKTQKEPQEENVSEKMKGACKSWSKKYRRWKLCNQSEHFHYTEATTEESDRVYCTCWRKEITCWLRPVRLHSKFTWHVKCITVN